MAPFTAAVGSVVQEVLDAELVILDAVGREKVYVGRATAMVPIIGISGGMEGSQAEDVAVAVMVVRGLVVVV